MAPGVGVALEILGRCRVGGNPIGRQDGQCLSPGLGRRTAPFEDVPALGEGFFEVRVRPRPGRAKNQGADPVGVVEGHRLGHGAAHGMAEDRRPVYEQVIKQCGGDMAQMFDRTGPVQWRAATAARMVEGDRSGARSLSGHYLAPKGIPTAEAGNE